MFKEIVTKAIVGKCKKTFRNNYELLTTDIIDTVLGCWVINHKMKADIIGDNVKINGSFDVNIWYSYDNNTKTSVEVTTVEYEEIVNVHLKEDALMKSNSEINLTPLKNPTVVDVSTDNNKIKYEIEKEIGIEIIGDTKVKIQVMNEEDEDYISLDEELADSDIDRIVDAEIEEKYLD